MAPDTLKLMEKDQTIRALRAEVAASRKLITELADALEARLMRPDQSTLLQRAREATK